MLKKLLVATSLILTWTLAPALALADDTTAKDTTTPTATTPAPKTEDTDKTSDKSATPAEPEKAATPTATSPKIKPLDVSKDAWFSQMKPILPALICKGFMSDDNLKKRFDSLKITYEQCAKSIPAIAKKCQDQYYSKIPDRITNDVAATWGRQIGECIGKEYAEKYLLK